MHLLLQKRKDNMMSGLSEEFVRFFIGVTGYAPRFIQLRAAGSPAYDDDAFGALLRRLERDFIERGHTAFEEAGDCCEYSQEETMPKDDTQANKQAGESWRCPDLSSEEDFSLESDEIFGPDIARHLSDEEMEAEFAYIEKCFSEMSLINQMPDKYVMLLEALLNHIERVLDRISTAKLDAYRQTQALLHTVNVREDSQYRRTYTGFYKLRLPTTVAYDAYFDLLENQKKNSGLSLRAVLETLLTVTRRVETSFASKLLATINPNVPPLDQEVMKHLGLRLPRYGEEDRIGKCILTHEMLSQQMRQMVLHPHFQALRRLFVARYPGYDFTDVKILDLLLWQFRVTKS